MKQNKVQHHLETNHPNCADKSVEYFERKIKSIQGQKDREVLRQHSQQQIN